MSALRCVRHGVSHLAAVALHGHGRMARWRLIDFRRVREPPDVTSHQIRTLRFGASVGGVH